MAGIISLSFWGYALATLALTHITILCVTIYLHRYQAHRSLELHPIISHFCRLWLWLTTGIMTKDWAAIHRKHHAKCETKEDPHSPQILGINKVLWEGAELYRAEAKNSATLERYGQGLPKDWIERKVYTPHSNKGYLITLFVNVILFGFPGITIWAIQMALIPFFAAGVINGLGHYWGYRNFECPDASTNIFPIGILIGGEELHNNHHAYPTSARFSTKWWEFDIGWLYIKLFSFFGLAKIKHTIPKVVINKNKHRIDFETLSAVIKNRYELLAKYNRCVLLPIFNHDIMQPSSRRHFSYTTMKLICRLRDEFQAIWSMNTISNNELLEYLHKWCLKAEASNIKPLREFVIYIRGYS